MKLRYALVWLILALGLAWAALTATAADVTAVPSIQDLRLLNPSSVNTNVYVVYGLTYGDTNGGIYTFLAGDATATNAVPTGPYDSELYPGLGRWFKTLGQSAPSGSTVTNDPLYITNVYVTNAYISNLVVTYMTVNSNVTFKGKTIFETNVTINGLLSVTNLTPNTVVKVDANTNLASISNGTGALTNNGSGTFGWFNLSSIAGTLYNVTNYFLAPGTGASLTTNITGTNVTWTVSATGTPYAVSNYFAAPGANMTITTNVTGTNVTWTFASAGSVYAVTNYFLTVASTNLTISTNVVGTNVTWTLDGPPGITGIITTNYTLDVGSNMTLDETIAGTNVTWTVRVNDPLVITNNIGATLSVGSTTYFDMNKASQTNAVSGSMTFSYATNGVDLLHRTHVRCLLNGSGSDQTLTFPIISSGANGWRTNAFSPVPPAITNNTVILVYLHCFGPTGNLAQQTNCLVSFEYY